MATIPSPSRLPGGEVDIEYPTGDGRPVAETPLHYKNLKMAVETLDRYFQAEPLVYVWGNMLVFYEKGNRRKHVSPDTFVALGVRKDKPRENYLIWEEGHGLDLVIELTSKSTKEVTCAARRRWAAGWRRGRPDTPRRQNPSKEQFQNLATPRSDRCCPQSSPTSCVPGRAPWVE